MSLFDQEWDRMRSPEARARDNQPKPERTPGPWFAQGPLIHGPDQGGIDIGPLIGEMATDEDAAYIVEIVNREWRATAHDAQVIEGYVDPSGRGEGNWSSEK